MKIHIFLIVLDFTQICVSIKTNISIHNHPRDPITSIRNKRQLPEYTRWQSNLLTTKREFIVKVDDEGFSPTHTTSIVGINIQSGTKPVDRIIIGGAIVPLPSSGLDTTPVEYTRFVPPTTVRTTGDDDIIYPQIKEVQGHVPPFSLEKHANRDDSPPAGPYFITRTPALAQFAPITPVASPVAFYPRVAASPVTPPTATQTIHQYPPSRALPPSELDHTRTTLEALDFNMLQPLSRDAQDLKAFLAPITRQEISSDATPTQTSTPIFVTSFPTWVEDTENIPTKQTADLDLDAYHMMFYNEDDNDVGSSKKKYDDSAGDDTKIDKHVNSDVDGESEDEANNHDIDSKDSRNESPKTETSSTKNVTITTEKLYIILDKSLTTKVVETQMQPTCSLVKYRPLRFNTPQTLPEIVLQLKKWSEQSPITRWIDVTSNNLTTMDNPIYMMIVDDPSSGQIASAKDVVMIVAGIQGRDHHAVSAAMYVLFQLIEHTDAHVDLLRKYRFWVIPVFNPDGYEYSMTFTQRREWTKNLHQSWEACGGQAPCKPCETLGLRCIVQPCYGVHLDRNFEYQWIPAEELRAEHPCGDLYAGTRQLSERETRALTTFLHEQKMPISTFVAFKEGDVLGVMYPYSHTRKKRAFDINYRKRASRAASAAFSISGRPYVAGQTSEFLPLYAGGIEDWIDGHLGIDNTYTIMMFRPADSYNSKLITEHVVHEAYAALDTLLLESSEPLATDALKPRASGAEEIGPTVVILSSVIVFIS